MKNLKKYSHFNDEEKREIREKIKIFVSSDLKPKQIQDSLESQGVSINFETLRSLIKRFKKRIIRDTSVEKYIESKKGQSYKVQQLLNIDSQARQKEYLNQLREAVSDINITTNIEFNDHIIDKSKDEEDVLILISDVHIGECFTSLESGNLGAYSKDIFYKQMEQFKKSVLKLLDIVQGYANIGRIWLIYLGDNMEGHNIFNNQAYMMDLNAGEASITFAKSFAEFEILLYQTVPFRELIALHIVGNHGHVSGSKGHQPITLNFDYLSYQLKSVIFENSLLKNNIFNSKKPYKIDICTSWFRLFDVKGWKFLAVHGDGIKSFLSIPFYGLQRADAQYLRLLKQHYTYFLCGHFHSPTTIPINEGELVVNGSWPGTSLYSGQKLRVGNPPSQYLFSVHEKMGKTATWKIMLREDYSKAFTPEVFSP